jgi:hypothetical protein
VASGRRLVVYIAVSWAAACSSPESPPAATTSSANGWTVLFDGQSLASWTPVGDANWRIVDDAVQADSGTGFLVSNEAYDDFDLELEFWVSPDANSGVFIRCASATEINPTNCYEVNIYDQRPDPSYRTGAIVEVATPAVTIDTGGRWNTYGISARGSRLRVVLNGQQTVDAEDSRLSAGPFALQYGAGTVMFRNVRIRGD